MQTDSDNSTQTNMPERGAEFRRLRAVAIFTAAYLLAATLLALARGNVEFLYYIAVMLILVYVVWRVNCSVVLTNSVVWGLSVWGLAHMAGGLIVVPETWPIDRL